MLFISLFIWFCLSLFFFNLVSHTTAGPPKKRHKGWSPESCANTQPENTLKTPPSSSPLSASSVPYVVTNGARSGGGKRQSYSLSPGKTTGRLLRENNWLSCAFHLVLSETTTQLSPPQGSSSPLSPPARSVTIPDQLLNTCRLQPIIFKGPISSRFTFCFHQPKQARMRFRHAD